MVGKTSKSKDLFSFAAILIIIVLVNFLGASIFTRVDLTSEKRYSLTDATKTELENLEDIIFVRVYLEGDLPAGFRRLKDATREMLDEMRVYAGDNLQYQFIDPNENPDEEIRMDIYRELSKKGLQYTNLTTRETDKVSEQIVFPGALVQFGEREVALQLLKSQVGADPEVMLNNSIQQLEYELIASFKKAVSGTKQKIAFLEGHQEISDMQVASITQDLSDYYTVERVTIDGQLGVLDDYKALIIAGPDTLFTDKDRFMIDQFVMRGNPIIWLVEPVIASMDSIRTNSFSMGLGRETGLEESLFRYGCRINSDFVLDLQALPIPVVTGMIGNQPQQEFFPWYYSPLIMNQDHHPIVKNLEAIKTSFVSSIDFVGNDPAIKQTPLLTTSSYSKKANTPHRISLNVLREVPDERQFNKGEQNIAVLLEGTFTSAFKNRLPESITENPKFRYRESSDPTAMIVISDADIIRNDVNRDGSEYFELGYDRYTNRVYGNTQFLLNCMNYLMDDSGLIEARNKEFRIRLLDKQRVKKEAQRWSILNTAVPVILILIFGFLHYFIRKRRYTRHK